MSDGNEKEVQEQKQTEELSPEELEKTSGGAYDAFLTFGEPKGEPHP